MEIISKNHGLLPNLYQSDLHPLIPFTSLRGLIGRNGFAFAVADGDHAAGLDAFIDEIVCYRLGPRGTDPVTIFICRQTIGVS